MKDIVGNKLDEGQLVWWRPVGMTTGGLIATIIHIDEPAIETGTPRQAQIVLAVPIPLDVPHGTSPAALVVPDVVRIVNPQQEARLDAILAGRGGMPQ